MTYKQMNGVRRACEIAGGRIALSNLLKVSPVTVHEWIHGKKKVPVKRCVEIWKATNGEVSVKELRDDWREIWIDFNKHL